MSFINKLPLIISKCLRDIKSKQTLSDQITKYDLSIKEQELLKDYLRDLNVKR